MTRYAYLLLLVIASLISSCAEDEIVSPAPAVQKDSTSATATKEQQTTTTAPAQQVDSTVKLGVDSAYYQSAISGSMPYRIMFPRKYDSTQQYPLIVFLHGIDERGTDNAKQLKWGASLFQSDSVSKNFPSFVVFPQCPPNHYWSDRDPMAQLSALIRSLVNEHGIDPNRIYVAGLSMGAYGTYAVVANNPGLFAAAVAISGDGDTRKVSEMSSTHWRIYGGGKDVTVSQEKSVKMANALKDSGALVELKIFPEANHVGSWVKAFAEKDFVSWIYAQKK